MPHKPLVDDDGDVVCCNCKLVMEVGPLGLNGLSANGLMYGKLVAHYGDVKEGEYALSSL